MSQKQIKRIRRAGREATKSIMGVAKDMEELRKENQLLKKRLTKSFDDAHMDALKQTRTECEWLRKQLKISKNHLRDYQRDDPNYESEEDVAQREVDEAANERDEASYYNHPKNMDR